MFSVGSLRLGPFSLGQCQEAKFTWEGALRELERGDRELKRQVKELQARLAKLEQENRALKDRLDQLEAELRRGRQAAPFSRDEKRSDPKRPGRHPGQGHFSYLKPPPEEEIQERVEVPLPRCPDCGGPLIDRATHERIQIDLSQR